MTFGRFEATMKEKGMDCLIYICSASFLAQSSIEFHSSASFYTGRLNTCCTFLLIEDKPVSASCTPGAED